MGGTVANIVRLWVWTRLVSQVSRRSNRWPRAQQVSDRDNSEQHPEWSESSEKHKALECEYLDEKYISSSIIRPETRSAVDIRRLNIKIPGSENWTNHFPDLRNRRLKSIATKNVMYWCLWHCHLPNFGEDSRLHQVVHSISYLSEHKTVKHPSNQKEKMQAGSRPVFYR